MLLWQTGLSYASRRMPKVIGPATHAVLDYAVAGAFLFMAARFWKRNRRAAMGSLLCGGAAVAGNLLTDYPGGALELLDYGTHRKMTVTGGANGRDTASHGFFRRSRGRILRRASSGRDRHQQHDGFRVLRVRVFPKLSDHPDQGSPRSAVFSGGDTFIRCHLLPHEVAILLSPLATRIRG